MFDHYNYVCLSIKTIKIEVMMKLTKNDFFQIITNKQELN